MPELAEVEFYRKQWNGGMGQKVTAVELHERTRIFRGTNTATLQTALSEAKVLCSESHGKQMLFRFSNDGWLGIHLGMTGKLRIEDADFAPGKHDHLVLRQAKQTLVFSDPRQFGRILFHPGKSTPPWWVDLPPQMLAREFTEEHVETFLMRHRKAPIKAVLLMQKGFPGIGNWMADEILWQAQISPRRPAGKLNQKEKRQLGKSIRFICRRAMETIGRDFSDPPKSWLFHQRWSRDNQCPKCRETLVIETVGGRTSCWCQRCQPGA